MGWRALRLQTLSLLTERGRPHCQSYGISFRWPGTARQSILSVYRAFMWANESCWFKTEDISASTPLLPSIPPPHPPISLPCLCILFLIHHCLLCNNISLSQTSFPSSEIDSSDDTKQFISPFIPCFLLIAPPAPLCVSGSEWEEVLERLIGYSANYPGFCGCPMMTGLMLGCREILERIM